MSRKGSKGISWFWKLLGVGICAALAAPMFPDLTKQAKFLMRSAEARRTIASDVMGTYRETYEQVLGSLNDKVATLERADREIALLRIDNVDLKQKLAESQFGCHSKSASATTAAKEVRLTSETGDHVGRALDGIDYKPPGNLIPSQLFTLGVSYFKAHEDEKAAVIMTELTGGEGRDAYRTAKNLLITGVLWYRLGNFNLADYYFDQTLKQASNSDNLRPLAQARLWKALIEKRENKELKVQYWLTELIDHHPHSKEAGWVNARGADRATASEH